MSSYNRKDLYYQKAKKEGYPSRSAYKLIEMNRQFGILKKGVKIVDLGSAPGGWLKVTEEKVGVGFPRPIVIGIDLLPLHYTPKASVIFIQGDFLEEANRQKIIGQLGGKADWVLSDLSPNISGIKFLDSDSSTELCDAALRFSRQVLN